MQTNHAEGRRLIKKLKRFGAWDPQTVTLSDGTQAQAQLVMDAFFLAGVCLIVVRGDALYFNRQSMSTDVLKASNSEPFVTDLIAQLNVAALLNAEVWAAEAAASERGLSSELLKK